MPILTPEIKNKLFNYLLLAVFLILVFALFTTFKSCQNPKGEIKPDSLKIEIKKETVKRDSVMVKAQRSDSVRIQYVIKWRKIKADTVYLPCDSVLHKVVHICDTLIQVDSTEISQLKRVNLLDSIIISDQAKIIKNDSISIHKLSKQIKRSKLWGKTGTAAGFVTGFVLGKL